MRLLTRRAAAAVQDWPDGVEAWPADIGRPETVSGCAEEVETVLHVAGLALEDPPRSTFQAVNVEGTRHLLEEARREGVRRFVYVSSLGAERGSSEYHASKRTAEELVKAFQPEWVILRPGNVYGPGDEVVSTLLKLVRSLPAVPVIDSGNQTFQPIWHEDLGRALAAAVEREGLAGAVLELGGPEHTSMNDLVRRLSALHGRRRARLPVPAPVARMAGRLARWLRLPFPVDETKLTLLAEHNVLRGPNGLDVLGVRPTPLAEGLQHLSRALPEQLPQDGVGPLRRKRFFARIEGSGLGPSQLRELFVQELARTLPLEVHTPPDRRVRLREGATFTLELPVRGTIPMRFVEEREDSLTFLTLDGHPLAGAVTFHFADGPCFEVEVHTRSATVLDELGLLFGGSILQDATWRDVVRRTAELAGGRVQGEVQESATHLEGEQAAEVERWLSGLVRTRKRRARRPAPSAP